MGDRGQGGLEQLVSAETWAEDAGGGGGGGEALRWIISYLGKQVARTGDSYRLNQLTPAPLQHHSGMCVASRLGKAAAFLSPSVPVLVSL